LVADDDMSAFGSNGRIENLSERRELSDAAKALLADKAFGHVYRQLYDQWLEQLLQQPHDGPAQAELAARLRALTIIPIAIGKLLENYRADAQKAARNAS
jgi:hypothetical protein